MKLDEILNSQKASDPVASTPMPITKKTGTLKLSDILSQQPSTPSPVQEIAPAQIRTVTNDDNTIKEGVNIAPTFTKTQKAKMGAKLAYNALTEGIWGLPEGYVRGVPDAITAFNRLTQTLAKTMPVIVGDEKKGKENAIKNTQERVKASEDFAKVVRDNTAYLDEWKQLGEEYRKAEDAKVPEEFRKSITGQISTGVGSSAAFLSTLLATRGLGMGAQFAGAGTKIGETLAVLANTSQKLGIPLNTLAESHQIKEQTRQELLEMGKDEKEAERLATNVFGVSVVATPALDAIGLFNPAIKKTLVKKLAQFGLDIKSEVAQELTQTGAQNVATDKEFFANAKETATVAGITSAIFSLLTKGHLSLKGEQAQPTATEPTVQADGTVTPPPEGTATPTVGDIIANGQENYTQEEKVTAINNADFENNLVDPTNEVEAGTQEYEDLKSDIKSAVDEGANIGEIILKLREAYTVSQEYAENIVAEVIATPEATAVVEEVVKPKTTPKKEAVKTPTKQEILDDKNVPKARKMAIEEIDYYLGASEAGRRQFTLEKDSYDYKVTAVPSTFPQFVPENMRSRKAFDRLQPYWEKQERPSNKTPMLQKLYDIFQNEVEKSVPENQKKIDEQMAQEARGDGLEFKTRKTTARGDGLEFKTRKTTATREMAVLDDFKKRYKVQFPTLIVSKIIEGKKTELHPKGDGEAEGATDGNTIALAFDAIINTGKHELIHLTLNNLDQIPELAKFSRQDILKAQAKKMGVELTKENEKTVEEQLALDFEAYQNKTYKPNNSTIAKFFASIRDMINNFRGVIVKSDGDVITQYYDAVLYGETARKQEVAITTESNVARYLIDNVLDYRPMYTTRRVLSLSNGITSVDFKSKDDKQPEFKEALNKSLDVYKESGDLTTKILKDLEGKTTVSKQYILDATNRGDVKQVEKDIIRDLLFFERDTVKVKEFAFKVQQELLPLYIKSSDNIIPNEDQDYNPFTMNNEGGFTPKWEFVNLPTNLRGDVEGYVENIYESPIPTVAGKHHYNYLTNNYFGHTRAEDVPNNVRRVIEVQSDLYQKGNLERETKYETDYTFRKQVEASLSQEDKAKYEASYNFINSQGSNAPESAKNFIERVEKNFIAEMENNRKKEIAKLSQYNDPTAHFRMIREEIRSATLDGKDVLQFPTGETAMKIEGLGTTNHFYELGNSTPLKAENIQIGKEISNGPNEKWIITDVLGDGKFKAVPKDKIEYADMGIKVAGKTKAERDEFLNQFVETFDISGKVDTNNPIYKFYEKEVGRYLKNNYKAEIVTDDKGVTWYEIKLKDEYKGAVVAFKERVTPEQNREEARKMFPRFTKAMEEKKRAQLVIPKKAELGIRSVAKRVEDRAKTLGVTVDESYEIKRFVTEVATSEVILENNKEKIEDILNGSFPYPTEVSKTAFLHTIIEDAKARNDTKTLTKAYNRLAEEATTAGQDIAFINSVYKMYDETSPETYLNKIKAERETVDTKKTWSIKNPFAGKEVREKIIRKKTERQKAIRLGVKERTTIKIQELESILDSFVC